MKIKKLETRQPWLCEVDGTTYVRTEIEWNDNRSGTFTWHLNEDQVEGKVYLTDEQLEKLFWENLDLPPDNYLIEQAREEPKQEKDYTALLKPVGTKQTSVEWLESEMLKPNVSMKDILEQAKEMENQEKLEAFIEGYKQRAEKSELIFDNASRMFAIHLYKETFNK